MESEQFEEKVKHIVDSLKSELKEVDAIYLMSLLNQKVIHSINPDPGAKSNLPEGFAQKFHYLCGLVASLPLREPRIEQYDSIDRVFILTDELFEQYSRQWISGLGVKAYKQEDVRDEYGAGLTAFLGALYQPKLGSTEQFIQFLRDQYEVFDERVFVRDVGFSIQQCIDTSLAIVESIPFNYQASINDYAHIMKPLIDLWQQYRSGEITFEESKIKGSKLSCPNESLKENTLKFVESFIVSRQHLTSRLPESVVDAYLRQFSFEPGSINGSFLYPSDFNQLDIKPLMQVGPDRYYVTEVTRLFPSLSVALLDLLSNSKLAQDYFKHRDRLAQRKTAELLAKVFPPDTVFEEAYYGYANLMEYETDLIVPYGRSLVICEIKAKALRDPLKTQGNIQKIKKDFKVSVQAGYDQALRTRDYVLSEDNALFVNQKKRPLIALKREDFDDYYLMVVTAESFGSLASYLSLVLEKKQDAPYPLAISLFDLELLLTLLNTPEKLLDYMKQRRQLHDDVYGADELDFAGYYIRYGNLDFRKQLDEQGPIVLGGDFSSVFDEDWFESHGFKVEKTTEPQGPYYSVLERRGDEVILHPHRSLLAAKETISQSHQQERTSFELKGRNRNSPCPCGSGKKYKKCCGRQ